MMRIEKAKEMATKIAIFPVRVAIGLVIAIKKSMPDKVELPFEIKRKESKWYNK